MDRDTKVTRIKDSISSYTLALVIILTISILYGLIHYQNIPPEYSDYKVHTVNYSGLPAGVFVRVYPESHIIKGDSFKIVFENWRLQKLYWGSDWKAEKLIDGEWVHQNPDWAWTAELRTTLIPFMRRVDTHNFPFDDGLYRITKTCMLTDVYLRDENRWESEFTATFYLIKTS